MKTLLQRPWWRPVMLATFAAGIALLGSGLHQLTSWAESGTIVGQAEKDVAGSPPWELRFEVPEAGGSYLLESTVSVAAPADRETRLQASPELRLTSPDGQRVDHELESAAPGSSVKRGSSEQLRSYLWLHPDEAGEYQLTMVNLHLEPAGAPPSHWAVRLARGVPREPGGRGALLLGFILAALAFVLYITSIQPPR